MIANDTHFEFAATMPGAAQQNNLQVLVRDRTCYKRLKV